MPHAACAHRPRTVAASVDFFHFVERKIETAVLEPGHATRREDGKRGTADVHIELPVDDELAVAVAEAGHVPRETDARTPCPLLQNRSCLFAHVLAYHPHKINWKAVGEKTSLVMPLTFCCAQLHATRHR